MKSLCRFAANRFSDTLTPFSRQTISHLKFSSFQNSTQSTYSSNSYFSVSISQSSFVPNFYIRNSQGYFSESDLVIPNLHIFYSGLFIKFMPFNFLFLPILFKSLPFYFGNHTTRCLSIMGSSYF